MCVSAGSFAGAADRLALTPAAVSLRIRTLEAEGLHVTLERTDEPEQHEPLRLQLDLLGADHPGIVAEVSAALAEHDVSIEELTTDVRDAPMAGGTLFEAHAVLAAPPATDSGTLGAVLEQLADELMVEIRLSED